MNSWKSLSAIVFEKQENDRFLCPFFWVMDLVNGNSYVSIFEYILTHCATKITLGNQPEREQGTAILETIPRTEF